MNARPELTGIVGDWLRQDAVSAGSDRVLAAAIAQVAGTDQDRYVAQRVFGDAAGRLPLVRLGLVLVPLLLGLAGGIVAGSNLLSRPSPGGSNGLIAYTKDFGCCGGVPTEIYLAQPGELPLPVFSPSLDTIDRLCPRFSPNGERLAYLETVGPGREAPGFLVVATIGAGGRLTEAARVQVAKGQNLERFMGCPGWSPLGHELAYLLGGELRLVDLETAESRVLTSASALAATWGIPDGSTEPSMTDPAWSPDGAEIAVAIGGKPFAGIVRLPIDGGGPVVVVRSDRDTFSGLAWAPDGAKIAWRVAVGDQTTIRALDVASRTTIDIPTGNVEIGPVWSPDGRLMAFVQDGGRIIVAGLDGQPGRALTPFVPATPGPSAGIGSPLIWSPDGTQLLYGVGRGEGSNAESNAQYALISVGVAPGAAPELVVPFGPNRVMPISWQEVFP